MATTPQSPVAYPLAIKKFQPHQNLIEDVDASHVNDLQNEVAMVQAILGTNPHQDPKLVNTYANKTTTNKWKTVAERLNFIQRRQDLPVFDLSRHAAQTYKTDVLPGPPATAIVFAGVNVDTHGLWNGSTGIRVKRPGYYYFTANMNFAPTPLLGSRQLIIAKNGQRMVRQFVPLFTGSTGGQTGGRDGSDIWLNVSWMGLCTPKDLITIAPYFNTEQFTDGKYTVLHSHLQGFMIRDI